MLGAFKRTCLSRAFSSFSVNDVVISRRIQSNCLIIETKRSLGFSQEVRLLVMAIVPYPRYEWLNAKEYIPQATPWLNAMDAPAYTK